MMKPSTSNKNDNAATEASATKSTMRGRVAWHVDANGVQATGEKAYEEFFTSDENVNLSQFQTVGIIDTEMNYDTGALDKFEHNILTMLRLKFWNKVSIISEVTNLLQGFSHIEKNKSLDEKM